MLLLSILFQFGIAWLLLTDLNGMESDSGNTINEEIVKKRALVIAPNFLEVHFKMLSVFANALTEEFNVVGVRVLLEHFISKILLLYVKYSNYYILSLIRCTGF